jgi:hypothetical protein
MARQERRSRVIFPSGQELIGADLALFQYAMMKINDFLALFRKNLVPPTQVKVEWRRHIFASALPLQALQLVHGAIKLPVQVSLATEEFVGCIRRRQAKALVPDSRALTRIP